MLAVFVVAVAVASYSNISDAIACMRSNDSNIWHLTFCVFPDVLSPSVDPEVPMEYSSEYDASDKSSMDDSDEACSIPGSFSPDNNQDGANGDQRWQVILKATKCSERKITLD